MENTHIFKDIMPDKFAYKDFGAFQMFMFVTNIVLTSRESIQACKLLFSFKAHKIWKTTALRLWALDMTEDAVFEDCDAFAGGRLWPTLTKKVCKLE